MSKDLISEVTIGTMGEILHEIGFDTRLAGTKEQPQLISSVGGINFNIRFGTPAQGKPGWTDFTISAPFTVDQEVSPVIGAFWNRRNRFARMYRTQDQLLLDMDVVLAGGVTRSHVKYLFAVWTDVSKLFVDHLRADSAVLRRYKAAGGALAEPASPTDGRQRPVSPTLQPKGKRAGMEAKVHASGPS